MLRQQSWARPRRTTTDSGRVASRRESRAKDEMEPAMWMQLRIADEMLTFPEEAALENSQVDKAMAAMGIAQILREQENVIVARGGG